MGTVHTSSTIHHKNAWYERIIDSRLVHCLDLREDAEACEIEARIVHQTNLSRDVVGVLLVVRPVDFGMCRIAIHPLTNIDRRTYVVGSHRVRDELLTLLCAEATRDDRNGQHAAIN